MMRRVDAVGSLAWIPGQNANFSDKQPQLRYYILMEKSPDPNRRLTPREAREARARALAYEANMAIEGLSLTPEGRALADYIDANGLSFEEGKQLILADLRRRGIIPDCLDAPALAAE